MKNTNKKTYKPNILKSSDKEQKRLTNVIFYDCECYTGQEDFDKENFNGVEKYKTYLICASFCEKNIVYQNVSEKIEGYSKTIEMDFWDDVIEFAEGKEVYIYAHFAQCDLIMSNGIPRLQQAGFKEKSFSYKSPFFFTYIKENTTIYLRDSFSIFTMGVDRIGKGLGIYKGDFKAHDIKPTLRDMTTRIEYCKRDVEIIKTAIMEFEKFLFDKWGVGIKTTSAGTCFNLYRQKFIKHEIELHNRENAIVIERESYHGGRTEVWKMGEFFDLYYIDVNSMYPAVMQKMKYPTKLIFSTSCWMKNEEEKKILLENIKKYIQKGFLITGIFEVETDEPVYAKKIEGHTIFPVGKFTTGLNTSEIEYAIKNKHIKSVLDFCVYEGEYILRDYVKSLYDLRKEYKGTFYEILIKLLLNALYGKFGQLDTKVTIYKDYESEDKSLNTFDFVKIDGVKTKIDILNGVAYIRKQQGNTFNTFVSIAGHVTSNARMMLWDCISKAGLKNIYYMDTDSLFLNEEGFNNIEKNGLIDNSELGKFKLEYKIKKAIFRGCKDYYIEDEKGNELNKIKGIGKNAEQLDYNTYLMKRPLTINDCKKLDNFDNFGSIYVTKHLKRIYKKGNIEGTQVIPHELTEEISTYLQTKFKRKKKYLKGKSSNDYNKNVG